MERMCKKCDTQLTTGARVCSCGYPTELATFQERIEHEIQEWRRHKKAQAS